MTTTTETTTMTAAARNAAWGLGLSAQRALTRLNTQRTITTTLATDHHLFLGLVAGGYATADDTLESIRQAAGLVEGVRIPSGTYTITYTITPEGTALVTA